jgi:hypothetical protein
LLHNTGPIELVGSIGSTTEEREGGQILISFASTPGVLAVRARERTHELEIKWEMALRLMTLIQVLVLQNRLLRGEEPVHPVCAGTEGGFSVEGNAFSVYVCTWETGTAGIDSDPQSDPETADQARLAMSEVVALQLVGALAEKMARTAVTLTLSLKDAPG